MELEFLMQKQKNSVQIILIKLVTIIDEKDKNSFGNYRKLVRLIKTIKIDSEKPNLINQLSSYDIQGLVYNIPSFELASCKPLELIPLMGKYLVNWVENEDAFKKLLVPDGTRRISKKVSIDTLLVLGEEIADLWNEIK